MSGLPCLLISSLCMSTVGLSECVFVLGVVLNCIDS